MSSDAPGSRKGLKRIFSHHEPTETERRHMVLLAYKNVIRLFVPIIICMIAVVATIKTIKTYQTDEVKLNYVPYYERDVTDNWIKVWKALVNTLAMLGIIVMVTILLVALYYYHCYKALYTWLLFSTALLVFGTGGFYIWNLLMQYNIAFDYISSLFMLWNFGMMGMISIHWKGPLLLQQGFLLTTSMLTAILFIKLLPDWTTWGILAILVIWDLIAVLCPMGPLKVLVETAAERDDNFLPGLIYSSTVMWTIVDMADVSKKESRSDGDQQQEKKTPKTKKAKKKKDKDDATPSAKKSKEAKKDKEDKKDRVEDIKDDTGETVTSPNTTQGENTSVEESAVIENAVLGESELTNMSVKDLRKCSIVTDHPIIAKESDTFLEDRENEIAGAKNIKISGPAEPKLPNADAVDDRDKQRLSNVSPSEPAAPPQTQNENSVRISRKPSDTEERGVRLGLGDFIFYSVLVGKASIDSDWNTTLACFIAILVGLVSTLMLLAIYRRALPALPISITFGLVFYFATTFLVQPYMSILNANQIFI